MTDSLLCVGVVTGARGLKGEVRIKSFTAVPEDIAAYGPVRDETGGRSFEIRVTGRAKGTVTARLEGVGDRDGAEALKGLALYVSRDVLPEAEDGEFYHADLIGLEAVFADGEVIGTVTAVHD
ncbi:MAG TPA: 16S rRNA processing protein RimM, partial [Rhodospirillales bacterium]|nr:16S rRNA processing protein RimM [Rhodospirillales bacterium]